MSKVKLDPKTLRWVSRKLRTRARAIRVRNLDGTENSYSVGRNMEAYLQADNMLEEARAIERTKKARRT